MLKNDLNNNIVSRRSVLLGSTTVVLATAASTVSQANAMAVNVDITPTPRAPFPPFTKETAMQKVRGAENGWDNKNPEKVSMAYSPESVWRNRAELIQGREERIGLPSHQRIMGI